MRRWLVLVAVMALPAVAAAQVAGQSPSEMILGAPSAPPAGTGAPPAGGPPWPGAPSGGATGVAPAAPSGGGSTAATPLSTPAAPLVLPDVGASMRSPADVATPATTASPAPSR
ncbi:MAG TPA: hypothetical protein VF334_23560 [Polyangia bacterium]